MLAPINFNKWIDEHRHLLKPPVGNQVVYKDTEFIIMVVGGPNARKDFHYNEGEEFFYQLEGDIQLPIIENGEKKIIDIKEGEIFLLPPKIPHSPQRGPDTIGLVIERQRKKEEMDACMWFCDTCNHLMHKVEFPLEDIVGQLQKLLDEFYADEELCTCSKCGSKMNKPELKTSDKK